MPPIARPALEGQFLAVLSVCQDSSLSLQPKNASIPAPLHISPTQPLALVSSAMNLALCASPQPPTAKPAKLRITRLQALSPVPVLSVMELVMSVQEEATLPVKPARLATTQLTDIPPLV